MTQRDQILALAIRAGVHPDEMRDDPEHGLLISASGVRKMASVAPDPARAIELADQLEMLAADRASKH